MLKVINALLNFIYYYPLFMAYLWIMGAVYYYHKWEGRGKRSFEDVPNLPSHPLVSIIVPCYNEGENIKETIDYLFKLKYPNYEVIVINDGSTDNTRKILDEMLNKYQSLRIVHLASNQGKPMGLRVGSLVSRGEYLICIDGDTVLDPYAVTWIMWHFINYPRVAAVTGNPRIRTRSTLLGKIQVGEFSAIIGMIKRAQRIYGRIFTVSGVVAGFRKSALQRVGYWSLDMITEDIETSWKLQLDHWDIRYEPNALCWMLAPETLKGLWIQRLRWAQGGFQVFFKHLRDFFSWRKRRMWPIFFEYAISAFWSYSMATVIVLWVLGQIVRMPSYLHVSAVFPPGWAGVILAITCLLQFAVSLFIDGRYEKRFGKFYYWMIWYPLVYWVINVATIVVGVPRALIRKRGKRAIWKSPDRGVR